MKNISREIFTDQKGTLSSMRVMSFVALLTAVALAIIPLFYPPAKEVGNDLHVLYFLTAAFAPKAVQKFAERDKPN